MKNLLRISLLLFVIIIPFTGQSFTNQDTSKEKKIELRGTFRETPIKSLIQTPICASISLTSLNVDFLSNLGNIDIEITSVSEGFVYNNSVNTKTQTSLSIDVSSWNSGVYQIRFENSDGRYMYGTFEIDL